MQWIVYNDLAWVEHILAPPESYKDEAMICVKAIESYNFSHIPTMLHLGCGAGGHDFHFKKHFLVTGVDLSKGMLMLAKTTNPEVTYVKGDMRNVKLNKKFDVVTIPDSVMYMNTLEDLRAALTNAAEHLKPGGVVLIVAHTKEEFRNNNFVYTGERNSVHVTLFENNHIVSDSAYEAVFIYLIRRNGEISIYHEVHTLGLFAYDQWTGVFQECSLKVADVNVNHLYDQNLLGDGEYKMKLFLATLMA